MKEKVTRKNGLQKPNNKETSVTNPNLFDIKENVRGVTGRIPQIKIIHQGQMFAMPNGKKVESFHARILHHSPANAFWTIPFDQSGGGSIPDCFSMNALQPLIAEGNEPISEFCGSCPKNAFGSDGRGKACKNMWRLHVLMEDSNIPKRVTLPPSNIGQIQDFMISLADAGIPFPLANVLFYLSPKKNKEGIEFSLINFEVVDSIDQNSEYEEALKIKKIINMYATSFGQQIISEEFSG